MYAEKAREIITQEIQEFEKMASHIDESFDQVVEAILACRGKLVLMGIGKTGIVAHKLASSLASTGTPAIFINAAEAVHGDLGMVGKDDIVMLVSNSGNTSEILNVIAPLRQIGCRLIALTGNSASPLANDCDLTLCVHVDKEACPLGLAPTTSTTAALLVGDALTVCLMEARQFKAENFAVYHPGGALGRRLLYKVRDRMSASVPRVHIDDSFKQVVEVVTMHHFGTAFVYDGESPVGIITDGDIRRAVQKYDDIQHVTAQQIMSIGFKKTSPDVLLTEALATMDRYNITTLAVVESDAIVGILSIHHIIDFT